MAKLSNRKYRPCLEVLEDRTAPATLISLVPDGTFRITDTTTVGNNTWTSASDVATNFVPAENTIDASLVTTLSFSQNELGLARTGANTTINMYWLRAGTFANPEVALRSATYFVNIGANETSIDVTYRPTGGMSWATTMGAMGVADARFFIRVYEEGAVFGSAGDTGVIRLRTGAVAGGMAGGLPTPTPGVSYGNTFAANWNMPGNYAIYTFASPDGETFEIAGANNGGATLQNASSDVVVFDGDSQPFAPGTTFTDVYATGTNTIGEWSGGQLIAALNSGNRTTMYSYTAVPDVLPTDGETVSVAVGDVAAGGEALWITLPTSSSSSVGFFFVPDSDANSAPEITSAATVDVDENQTAVLMVTATDDDDDELTFNITGGADQALFAIDEETGQLTFQSAPDFENPADADEDNVYEVEVTVEDGNGGEAVQALSVTVIDVSEPFVGPVTVSAQSGTLVYGAAGDATYTVTVDRASGVTGAFSVDLSITTTLPSGASAAFGSTTLSFLSSENQQSTTLTISSSSTTNAGSTSFTVKAQNTATDFQTGNAIYIVDKKTASVTPNVDDKTYGAADPTLTGTLVGFLSGDNVVASYSRVAGETVASGPYSISATLSPAGVLGNYQIEYNTADFTIIPRAITVTADPQSKTYGDDDPDLSYLYTGSLVGSDVFSGALARAPGEDVGQYAITQGGTWP